MGSGTIGIEWKHGMCAHTNTRINTFGTGCAYTLTQKAINCALDRGGSDTVTGSLKDALTFLWDRGWSRRVNHWAAALHSWVTKTFSFTYLPNFLCLSFSLWHQMPLSMLLLITQVALLIYISVFAYLVFFSFFVFSASLSLVSIGFVSSAYFGWIHSLFTFLYSVSLWRRGHYLHAGLFLKKCILIYSLYGCSFFILTSLFCDLNWSAAHGERSTLEMYHIKLNSW